MQLYSIYENSEDYKGKIDENLTWDEAQSFYGREATCSIVAQ
jgi:hypothetical protein